METVAEQIPPIIEWPGHSSDREAIRAVIADVEGGFNTNDIERSVRHFAANATTTTALGVQLAGREAIRAAHRQAFAGPLRDQYARYEVDEITFLRPDVARVQKRAWATDASGALLSGAPAMVALYVMVKERGRWWIASRANTLVPSE